jgi:hypothetical protein
VRYIESTSARPFAEAMEVGLAETALSALSGFLYALAEGILEGKLNTLRTGGGIL